MAAGKISENENRNIIKTAWPIVMKFLPKLHATIRNLKKTIHFRFGPKSKMAAGKPTENRKSQYLKDRLTDRYEIFIVASCHHWKPEKQSTSGSDQNPRWRPEIAQKHSNLNILGTVWPIIANFSWKLQRSFMSSLETRENNPLPGWRKIQDGVLKWAPKHSNLILLETETRDALQ